jgi:2-C-methyl-D-erythritol 2,4-cyclodiphosphate synthase
MNQRIPRVGIGYDVHPFKEGRKLVLGGVRIPHSQGLLGHSDADVLLHAICDALLGAAALGDIGRHFPNRNPKYRNVSSLLLLSRVGRLLGRNGIEIVHVDSTVLLEKPKILKFAQRMRRQIARALNLKVHQISIKATSNEELGFVGRGEGCAALAVATVLSR